LAPFFIAGKTFTGYLEITCEYLVFVSHPDYMLSLKGNERHSRMRNATYLRGDLNRGKPSDVVQEEYRDRSKVSALGFLWIPAILIFGVGDILTTQIALSLGAVERNSLVSFLIEGPHGLWAFGMFKAVVLIPLSLISLLSLKGKLKWIVPFFVCCLGICMLGGNLSVIGSLL